jgi:hypothetical protein
LVRERAAATWLQQKATVLGVFAERINQRQLIDTTALSPRLLLTLTGWQDFSQNFHKPRPESGRESASPDSFFPSFRPAVAELTNLGTERSVL